MRLVLRIGVAHGAVHIAVVHEFGSKDVAVLDLLTIAIDLFIQHLEAVSLADVQREIDVPAENAGQLHDDVIRNARIIRGEKQRGVYRALCVSGAGFRFHRMLDRSKLVVLALDQQIGIGTNFVAQCLQAAAIVGEYTDGVIRKYALQLFRGITGLHDFIELGRAQAGSLEQIRQAVAGFNLVFAPFSRCVVVHLIENFLLGLQLGQTQIEALAGGVFVFLRGFG